jgi:copper resistance protein C
MRSVVFRGWFIAILAALTLLMAVPPAGAHAELESSDPTDGATLSSAPSELTFIFGEQIIPEGNAVTLTDVEADIRLEVGPVEVDGDTVSVTWPQASPAGEFRAAYRVVSEDGHPIDGTITFTVQEAVGIVSGSPSAVTASPDAVPTPTADQEAISASAAAVSESPTPTADDGDAGLLAWVLGIGLAVLIGAGAGIWVMRRMR